MKRNKKRKRLMRFSISKGVKRLLGEEWKTKVRNILKGADRIAMNRYGCHLVTYNGEPRFICLDVQVDEEMAVEIRIGLLGRSVTNPQDRQCVIMIQTAGEWERLANPPLFGHPLGGGVEVFGRVEWEIVRNFDLDTEKDD
jgi:hypothetical protein